MKKQGPIWKEEPQYQALVVRAKKLFPTILAHVEPDKIFICSYTKRKSDDLANIRPVKPPWSLGFKGYDYILSVWNPRFEGEKTSMKLFVITHELFHIPQGGHTKFNKSHRKVVKHDIEDFMFFRQMYGLELHNVKDIFKGEALLVKKPITRFPRTVRIK